MRRARSLGLVAVLACGAAAAQATVPPLRLCADPSNLPFSSNAPEALARGEPGLYVEIGHALADALGRPFETVWSLSYFGKRNLRGTLLAGQCDLAVGLPAVDDFMGPRVIFSKPILGLGYALAAPRGIAAAGLEGLKGRRVAVQFGTPPQSLLATHPEIVSVTVMDSEEGMRRLAAGEVEAAFVWGPSAGYINHAMLRDRFEVVAVQAPQMQFPAAIGFSSRSPGLRDEVDAVLVRLAPRIRELQAKYAVAEAGPALTLTDAGPVKVAAAEAPTGAAPPAASQPVAAVAEAGNVAEGRVTFNGTCAHCHGPNAVVEDRKINLRRLHRKYGDEMPEVFFKTVTEGRPSKGMPSWSAVFKHEDFVNILAYLKTVQEN